MQMISHSSRFIAILTIIYFQWVSHVNSQYSQIWYDPMSNCDHWSKSSSYDVSCGYDSSSCQNYYCAKLYGGGPYITRTTNIASYSSLQVQVSVGTNHMESGDRCAIRYEYDNDGDKLLHEINPPNYGDRYYYWNTVLDLPSAVDKTSVIIWLENDSSQGYMDSGDSCYFDNVYLRGILEPTPNPTPKPTATTEAPTQNPTRRPSQNPTKRPSPNPTEQPILKQTHVATSNPTNAVEKEVTIITYASSGAQNPMDTKSRSGERGPAPANMDITTVLKYSIAPLIIFCFCCCVADVWIYYKYCVKNKGKKRSTEMINSQRNSEEPNMVRVGSMSVQEGAMNGNDRMCHGIEAVDTEDVVSIIEPGSIPQNDEEMGTSVMINKTIGFIGNVDDLDAMTANDTNQNIAGDEFVIKGDDEMDEINRNFTRDEMDDTNQNIAGDEFVIKGDDEMDEINRNFTRDEMDDTNQNIAGDEFVIRADDEMGETIE
eukprot:551854_1